MNFDPDCFETISSVGAPKFSLGLGAQGFVHHRQIGVAKDADTRCLLLTGRKAISC